MADVNVTFTQAQIDALADAISKNQAMGGKEAFCKNWDTTKEVLDMLRPILGMVPGVGIFAGPAISAVIVAGDAAKRAVCPG
jgi:hypothetical protein